MRFTHVAVGCGTHESAVFTSLVLFALRVEAGAIYLDASGSVSTNITNCTFQDNYSSSNGGVLVGAYFHVTNCTFDLSYARQSGGAIYQLGGTASISNSIFRDSQALDFAGAVSVSVRLHLDPHHNRLQRATLT